MIDLIAEKTPLIKFVAGKRKNEKDRISEVNFD